MRGMTWIHQTTAHLRLSRKKPLLLPLRTFTGLPLFPAAVAKLRTTSAPTRPSKY